MTLSRPMFQAALVVLTSLSLPIPALATTLIRQGLDRLAADSRVVVRAKVLGIHSYWNAERTFIFTDVHARPSDVIKGRHQGDLTFTIMGGTVGEVTVMIVGGPDLAPGSEYVLFLDQTDFPGDSDRLTIRELSQGVFDVRDDVAFSQALGEPLIADEHGQSDVPGGEGGLPVRALIRQIRDAR